MAKRYAATKEITVGVIGYGGAFNMGRKHLEEMRKAGMTPQAVVELDPERLKVAEADFPGIETYDTVASMLKKSDVHLITLITPHNTHAPLGLQCLRAGKHVVCEKPFAITTAECDAMIKEARKRRLVLSTYHNRHWDGCILQAIKSIRGGAIGRIVRIECHMGAYGQPRDWWRSSRSISGGVLYDWGVHLLEYALQLIDANLVEVSGFAHRGHWADKTAWKEDTNEDEAFAVARFDNGSWLTLCITHLDNHPKPYQLEITGTGGSYLFDGSSYKIIQPHKAGKLVQEGRNPPGEGEKFYENIAVHLVKGEPLIISPEWARRPIHILDLAVQSARKNVSLKAKYK